VNSVFQAFAGLHFEFLEQFLAALLPIALTVVVHGQAMHGVGRYYRRYVGHGAKGSGKSSRAITPIVIVAIMLVAHFLEIGGWAVFYVATGLIGDARSAMNFSIDAYTTLGGSNIILPLRWQGLDGMESMTAMLMFGWSTAVLATAMKSEFT
jgi:hypothetical protein